MSRNDQAISTKTLDADLQAKIAAGELDAIEELWLERTESRPEDLEWFVETAKAVRAVDSDMAEILLQTLDDRYKDLGHAGPRLELLRNHGRSMYKNAELHDAIVDTLGQLYGEHSAFHDLLEKVGLDKAPEDIPKTWKKAEKLEGLLVFDVGTVVRMKDKGAGRIEEINLALENFLVSFHSGLSLRVGFAAAAKMLDALQPGHVLYRKLEAPDELKALAKDDPAELLHLVLESEPGGSLTTTEIKAMLDGVVSAQRWNSFWNAARKHPQVIADPKKRNAYAWAESKADAHGTLLAGFEKASVQERLTMLRRDAARDDKLKRAMSEILWQQAADLRWREAGSSAEIWLQLEKNGVLPSGDADADWRPAALLAEAKEPKALFAGVQDRACRERVYEITRETREDWAGLFAEALWQETDARALNTLSEALLAEEEDRFWSFFDQIVSQPRKNPAAFTWLLERAADREAWMQRNALRLMRQFLTAMTDDAFAPYRAARLVPLTESGGTLPRLLDHLTVDQAETALETVQRSPGLQDYQREPLSNAIKLRFPDLHKETEAPLYATEAKIRAKRAELKNLHEKELPENRKAIEEAREMGDLRENFEYHAARRRHEQLSDRAAKIDEDLRRVRPIDSSQIRGDEVAIGATLHLKNGDDERTLTILGPWESDPEKGILSNESELAQKLLGSKVGDEVELPDGTFTLEKIASWAG